MGFRNLLLRAGATALAAVFTMLFATADVQARYATIVIDFETGEVIKEVNADTRNYPASLVKMMTLYMAFEALHLGNLTLDQELPVSRRATGMPPSRLGLKKGGTIKVRDVILSLVTKSANDAAVVMAEALGTKESRFARMMTKKARKLGMKRTSFRNASGLPNRRQLSTARDMATLARALIRDFPQYYEYFSTADFTYNGRKYRNHNGLLRHYDGTDGLKTGYTRASGFNLAASAVRNGRRLIAVVFGGRSPASRDRQVARLLDQGFKATADLPLVASADSIVARAARESASGAKAVPEAPAPTDAAASRPATAETKNEVPPPKSGRELAWGVQVGAYYRYRMAEAAAIKAAARIPALLADTRIHVPSIRGRRGRIYRARLLGLTQADARGACRKLEALKTDCLVVKSLATVALKKQATAIATN